ncbi:MAG TPA: superinfection immunity protein [Stellaceae bacterium]|nr:superinfection immunity protein [Stellaceae bacterium]
MFDSTTTVIMLIIVVAIYMLPTLIAFGREHPRRMDLAVVNILFGWTLIGWFAVFFWALLARTAPQPT